MGTHGRKNPADRNLGMRIELCRRRRGFTQEQLGKRLGVTGAAVSHWESGRFEPPRDKMQPLADLFGVRVGWLHGEGVAEDQRPFEERCLQGLLEGGPELEELLDQFDSIADLIAYLKKYRARTRD